MNTVIKTVKLEKKLVGHILQSNNKYFYRPSKTPKIKTPHNQNTDGPMFDSIVKCQNDIIGEHFDSFIEFSPYVKK